MLLKMEGNVVLEEVFIKVLAFVLSVLVENTHYIIKYNYGLLNYQ